MKKLQHWEAPTCRMRGLGQGDVARGRTIPDGASSSSDPSLEERLRGLPRVVALGGYRCLGDCDRFYANTGLRKASRGPANVYCHALTVETTAPATSTK